MLSKFVRFEGDIPIKDDRAFYSFWHEDLVYLSCWAIQNRIDFSNFLLILSRHRDAEIALPLLNDLGIESIRGSARKGFIGVARALKAASKAIIVIADGPKGPYRKYKKNILSVAKKLGRPIYHFEFDAKFFLRLPTWDRCKIPLPGSRAKIIPVSTEELEFL